MLEQVEDTFSWGRENNYIKGARYESLAKYLLGSLTACKSIHNIPTSSNQIDYKVELQARRFSHPLLDRIQPCFIVECKNENSSISSREVADIINLMDDFSGKEYTCHMGLFIARKNISSIGEFDDGNARRYKEYFKNGRVIIAITFDDIKNICLNKLNFLTVLREKYESFVNEQDLKTVQ